LKHALLSLPRSNCKWCRQPCPSNRRRMA
jgi:hypothetical protein